MNIAALSRILALMGLCLVSVPIMGAGNDCPKACIVELAPCETECNSPSNDGTCRENNGVLYCDPNAEPPDPGATGG